jgi:4-amino-4-deoxychorismate lyase
MTPGLIETMLFQRGSGLVLLEAHLARLAASATHFGIALDGAAIRARLLALVRDTPEDRLRVRLVLHPDGAVTLTGEALAPPPPGLVWRVAMAQARFASDEPLLRHKTTLRARYEEPLALAGTDEVLFLNERGALCEGARSNLFVQRGDRLLTPPLCCGLLPGTLRGQLLAEGRAEEALLVPADLAAGPWFMGNSVRGLVPARLVLVKE